MPDARINLMTDRQRLTSSSTMARWSGLGAAVTPVKFAPHGCATSVPFGTVR